MVVSIGTFNLPVELIWIFTSVQGNDGKELPVPISDVMERLVDLEKRLLVQEQKNVDLEKRPVDQGRLNKVQMEKLRELSTCGCKGKGFSGEDRSDLIVDRYPSNLESDSKSTSEDFHGNSTGSSGDRIGSPRLNSFKRHLHDHSPGRSLIERNESNKKSVRETTDGPAFYAYLSMDEKDPGNHQTIIFDHVITNVGGNYNHHKGIFTSPDSGVYVFSWTLYCDSEGFIFSEIVVNSAAFGAMACSALEATSVRHTSSTAVLSIAPGDVVFVRTHAIYSVLGKIPSQSSYRSSFSGWRII